LSKAGIELFKRVAANRDSTEPLLRQESGTAWKPSTYQRPFKAALVEAKGKGDSISRAQAFVCHSSAEKRRTACRGRRSVGSFGSTHGHKALWSHSSVVRLRNDPARGS
jgi:hypothetical protein